MTIRIGEVRSRIHAADSSELLDPEVMERVVAMVTERVKEELERERRRERESIGAGRIDGGRF